MPKANAAKTASAPKKLFAYAGIAAVVMTAAYAVSLKHASPLLRLGNRNFSYETAVTQQEQEQGLSYRSSLGDSKAMLFIFKQPAVECFWMKDMNFPLDMIWLDSNKRIVHIEQNAQPNSYPSSFCPIIPSQYVIEVNAGTVAATGLKVGDPISF